MQRFHACLYYIIRHGVRYSFHEKKMKLPECWILLIVMSLYATFHSSSSTSILKKLEMEREKYKNVESINIPFGDYEEDENKVGLPGHLKAMKIERDGGKNMNYHKEVFLGAEAGKFRSGDYQISEQKTRLHNIFKAVDLNSDDILNVEELTLWVLTKTREHFYEARMSNEKTFQMLDGNKDGRVTWNEFISHFLSENGFEKEDIFKRLEKGGTIKVPEDLDGTIKELREKWIQVQDVDQKSLTISQFLDFQHPETSKGMLQYLVEDILHDMDMDNSNDLTVQEYVAMPPGANVNSSDDLWVVERREEFRKVIDEDKDGTVTAKELEAYLDPLSKNMASQEARQLIGFGDSNEDGFLTLKEILENSEYYTGSKLFNYALSVHEEF